MKKNFVNNNKQTISKITIKSLLMFCSTTKILYPLHIKDNRKHTNNVKSFEYWKICSDE